MLILLNEACSGTECYGHAEPSPSNTQYSSDLACHVEELKDAWS